MYEHSRIIELIRNGQEQDLDTVMKEHHDYASMKKREKDLRNLFPEYFPEN